jgi:tetratricopeptide (TPR) repeat protein
MTWNNRGWSKYKLKKYSDALKDLNKSIELDPRNWAIYDSRQEIKFMMNNLKGCIEDCNTVISLNPKISNSYFYRGRACYKQGNKKKA